MPLSLSDIHFGQEWAFTLVIAVALAPVLIKALALYASHRSVTEDTFVSQHMRERLYDTKAKLASFTKTISLFYWLCALLLATALTRPQWGIIEETIQQQGIDVIIAIDLSASMRAQDLKPSRIENARQELAFLAEELKGNRVGLVGFAGSAFLFCPLTLDTDAVEMFLDEMTIEAVPVPGTALGDAIETALTTFKMSESDQAGGSKVLLLLTDGEDAQSDPIGAAQKAAKEGVTIDTIGVGTLKGGEIPDPASGDLIRDSSGAPVISKLDGKTLEEISKLSGGIYMRLDGSDNGLKSYLEALKLRKKRQLGERINVKRQERFPYFLMASGLCFLLALSLEEWDKRR